MHSSGDMRRADNRRWSGRSAKAGNAPAWSMSLCGEQQSAALVALSNKRPYRDPKLKAAPPLILVYGFQLGHEHQPADAQAVQLSLPFG